MEDNGSGDWWDTKTNDLVATSPDLWRPLSKAIDGFDLDPAAGCEPTPIADERYTESDDGLTSPWFGTVWLNPPFSNKIEWYRRLVAQYRTGNINRAVAIAKVDTSPEWFQRWFSTADVICFLNDRDVYLGHGDNPSFSTMVGVWNPTDRVVSVLSGMGTVARPTVDTPQSTLPTA